jgi:cytochrome c-type biogenesis protein CcmH/NrfG
MRYYWTGLLIAAVCDAALIVGPGALTTERVVVAPAELREAESPTLGELNEISAQIDSLMLRLQGNPEDAEALAALADLYTSHGWWEEAIGPLARALALDPENSELVKEIELAVDRSGRAPATAAELTRWAEEFLEVVSMWGHSC